MNYLHQQTVKVTEDEVPAASDFAAGTSEMCHCLFRQVGISQDAGLGRCR